MFSPCEPHYCTHNRDSVLNQPKAQITFPLPDLRSTQLTTGTSCSSKTQQQEHPSVLVLCKCVWGGGFRFIAGVDGFGWTECTDHWPGSVNVAVEVHRRSCVEFPSGQMLVHVFICIIEGGVKLIICVWCVWLSEQGCVSALVLLSYEWWAGHESISVDSFEE